MPGGVDSGPFKKGTSGGSSRRSSIASCQSARGSRSVTSLGCQSGRGSRSVASLGGSSAGSGARSSLRAAVPQLSGTELSELAGKLGQEAAQRYGSLSNALKSVKTDNRGGVSRTEMRSLGDEYGITMKESDLLFEALDEAKEGTVNLKDFTAYVNQKTQVIRPSSEKNGDSSGKTQDKPTANGTKIPAKKTSGERRCPLKKEIEHIFHDIAIATGRNHKSVREAFKAIQMWGPPAQSHDIDRSKFTDYMKLFGYDDSTGNRVFDHLDADGSGQIDYREFQNMFGPYILPDWDNDKAPVHRRDLPPPTKPVNDKSMSKVIDDIGKSITAKYANAHECFRACNADDSGTMSKDDVRVFFERFSYPPKVADAFFDKHLTLDSEGLCDYREFTSHFTPYITQGYNGKIKNHGPAEDQLADFEDEHKKPPPKLRDAELTACIQAVGENASKKFATIRRAWRSVDLQKEGYIDRAQLRVFFNNMGYEDRLADKFFDYVNIDNEPGGVESIDYHEFSHHFGPLLYGYSQLGQEDNRLQKLQGHYQDQAKRCKFTHQINKKWTPGPPSDISASGGSATPRSSTPRRGASSCGSRKSEPSHLTHNDAKHILRSVGTHMARNLSSVRKAFCAMNPERKGAIDRKKFSDFLATYNYNESISNQVFDFIDEDGSGGMDYMEFCDMFGPYLMPDWTDKDREQRPRAPSLTIPPPRQLEDRKMRKVIEDLGTSLAMRHKSAQHVFRTLDAENDGTLSKTKVREFFARQSYPKDVADRFFATFPKDSDGEISSHEFTSYFTPYIIKGYDGKGINEVPQYMSKVKIPLRPAYVKDPELRAVLPGLEEAVKSRFPDLRQAFRAIDIEKDGKLERRDIQKFLGSYGYSKTISDKFFDHLNKEDDNHIDYMEFQAYFAPVIYGYPQLGLERNTVDTLKQRAQSEGRKASVMGEGWESTLQQEAPKLRSRSSCSRSASVCESLTERSDRTRSDRTQSARGPRALRSSDSGLNRVVANIGETMKARHGDCRSAFKRVATSHKDYVTRGDVQKLFRNYGYGESADQFFDRLDGDKTGAVAYTSFQKIFAKQIDQADGSQSGQSTYRSAFGG